MHDWALKWKIRGLSSAPRVEHTGHYSEIATRTTLQNHIKINIVPNIIKHSFNHSRCSENAFEGNIFQKFPIYYAFC